jgi:hypothetical protein
VFNSFLCAVNLVEWNFECSKTCKNERVLQDIKLQRPINPGGVKWANQFYDSVDPIYSVQIGLGKAPSSGHISAGSSLYLDTGPLETGAALPIKTNPELRSMSTGHAAQSGSLREDQRRVGRFLTSLAMAGQFDARRTGAGMAGRRSIRSSSPYRTIVRLLAFNLWMAIDSAGILSSDNRPMTTSSQNSFLCKLLAEKTDKKTHVAGC